MKKIRNQKGFTLTEMLACVVALLLLAGICTMGTDLAVNSYNRSLFESNSQMLESTLNTYIGDIVRHAKFEVDASQNIKSITNSLYQMQKGRIAVAADGRIYIYKDESDVTGVLLLTENLYANTLTISRFELRYYIDGNGKYITGSYTIESTVVDGLSRECEFEYRIATTY